LKETVQDIAKELKKSPSGELRRTANELENFMNKVCKIVTLLMSESFYLNNLL